MSPLARHEIPPPCSLFRHHEPATSPATSQPPPLFPPDPHRTRHRRERRQATDPSCRPPAPIRRSASPIGHTLPRPRDTPSALSRCKQATMSHGPVEESVRSEQWNRASKAAVLTPLY